MKYTVTINEKSKTVTVNLNGYEGVAKCCATDTFNLQTGIELALERAKIAEANAKKPVAKPMGVMELIKALEKALPKGQMVIVGNGKEMTAEQKRWLANLAGVTAQCNCDECNCEECGNCDECDLAYTDADLDNARDEAYAEGYEKGRTEGYSDGYEDGHADGYAEGTEEGVDEDEIIEAVRNALHQ